MGEHFWSDGQPDFDANCRIWKYRMPARHHAPILSP